MKFWKRFAINFAYLAGIMTVALCLIGAIGFFMEWCAANFPKAGGYIFVGGIILLTGAGICAIKAAAEAEKGEKPNV